MKGSTASKEVEKRENAPSAGAHHLSSAVAKVTVAVVRTDDSVKHFEWLDI